MTIETKTRITYGGLTVEREFKWDALSSVSRFLFSPLALISRLGEADRIDHERGRPHDFVGDRRKKRGPT
jgi:hypothetical protein